jgi:hypothetical protein
VAIQSLVCVTPRSLSLAHAQSICKSTMDVCGSLLCPKDPHAFLSAQHGANKQPICNSTLGFCASPHIQASFLTDSEGFGRFRSALRHIQEMRYATRHLIADFSYVQATSSADSDRITSSHCSPGHVQVTDKQMDLRGLLSCAFRLQFFLCALGASWGSPSGRKPS